MPVRAVPDGNAVTPPQLPRDAPRADVLEIREHDLRLLLRRAAHSPFPKRRDRRPNKLFHLDPPLQHHERLDAVARAIAVADGVTVRLALPELVVRTQPFEHALVRFRLGEARKLAGLRTHAAVEADHHWLEQVVVAADLPV